MKTYLLILMIVLGLCSTLKAQDILYEIWFLRTVEIDGELFHQHDENILGYETQFEVNLGSLTICNSIELSYQDVTDSEFFLTGISATLQECPDQPGLDAFEEKFSSLFWNQENQTFTYTINTDPEWDHLRTLIITNPNGDKAYFSNDALGNTELPQRNLSIFPNPVVNELNVKVDANLSNVSLKILDSNGQIVLEEYFDSWKNLQKIDMKSFPTGTYLVSIKSDQGTFTKKLMKK